MGFHHQKLKKLSHNKKMINSEKLTYEIRTARSLYNQIPDTKTCKEKFDLFFELFDFFLTTTELIKNKRFLKVSKERLQHFIYNRHKIELTMEQLSKFDRYVSFFESNE